MNILVDYHHDSLLNSFVLLFEKRLGYKVWRPIGMDWYTQGYWKINDQLDTAKQFLEIGSVPIDGTPPLNNAGLERCVTLNNFFKFSMDIVIATIPEHIEPFKKLCALHPSKPKFIYQIGNQWNIDPGLVENVLASAKVDIPPGVNAVTYHQEFDTFIFKPDEWIRNKALDIVDLSIVTPGPNIFSFINILQHTPDYPTFLLLETWLASFRFKSYGGQCRDGNITGAESLANEMRQARFIWHVKAGGDGYGHVLHNAAAVGRPVIVNKSYYAGKLAEVLLIDGVTCIAIDNLSVAEIVSKIEYYNEEGRYRAMCRAMFDAFNKSVDFDGEAELIKRFIQGLK